MTIACGGLFGRRRKRQADLQRIEQGIGDQRQGECEEKNSGEADQPARQARPQAAQAKARDDRQDQVDRRQHQQQQQDLHGRTKPASPRVGGEMPASPRVPRVLPMPALGLRWVHRSSARAWAGIRRWRRVEPPTVQPRSGATASFAAMRRVRWLYPCGCSTWRSTAPSASRSNPSLICSSRIEAAAQLLHRQLAALVQRDEPRECRAAARSFPCSCRGSTSHPTPAPSADRRTPRSTAGSPALTTMPPRAAMA